MCTRVGDVGTIPIQTQMKMVDRTEESARDAEDNDQISQTIENKRRIDFIIRYSFKQLFF